MAWSHTLIASVVREAFFVVLAERCEIEKGVPDIEGGAHDFLPWKSQGPLSGGLVPGHRGGRGGQLASYCQIHRMAIARNKFILICSDQEDFLLRRGTVVTQRSGHFQTGSSAVKVIRR